MAVAVVLQLQAEPEEQEAPVLEIRVEQVELDKEMEEMVGLVMIVVALEMAKWVTLRVAEEEEEAIMALPPVQALTVR